MPDITMIPAIASFFSVTTDELFDFNLYEVGKKVEAIVDEYSKYWDTDKAKAEQVIRDGLKKYTGNDILLNCMIGVLSESGKNDEVITVGKYTESVAKELGGSIKIVSFIKYERGEGIEKKEDNFAEEINKLVNG